MPFWASSQTNATHLLLALHASLGICGIWTHVLPQCGSLFPGPTQATADIKRAMPTSFPFFWLEDVDITLFSPSDNAKMASVPKTMKAWIATRTGDPGRVLELKTNWPTPAPPKGNDIMIKVSFASLNPLDLQVMAMWLPWKWYAVPAVDFTGEVVQAGPSVASSSPHVRVGMTVCGMLGAMHIFRGFGTLAEYVVLPASMVAEMPMEFKPGPAAGLMGVAGQTAVILLRRAALSEGQRALVNGASGGVGSLMVQVLQANGVHVTGICSGKNEAMVRRLGASEVQCLI
jgi:NADPH:quinone reductase-like Zn-dependent oxidoreductase